MTSGEGPLAREETRVEVDGQADANLFTSITKLLNERKDPFADLHNEADELLASTSPVRRKSSVLGDGGALAAFGLADVAKGALLLKKSSGSMSLKAMIIQQQEKEDAEAMAKLCPSKPVAGLIAADDETVQVSSSAALYVRKLLDLPPPHHFRLTIVPLSPPRMPLPTPPAATTGQEER